MSSSRTTSRFIVDPIKPSTSSSSGGRLSLTNENSTRSHPTRRYIGSRTTAYGNGASIPEALTLREKAQKFQALIDEHKKVRGETTVHHVWPLQQNDKKSSANNEKKLASNSKKHGEIDDNTKKLSNTKLENGENDNTKKLSKTKSEKEVKLRKPKTFGKDGVRSRTRELVENFFDSLTRRNSNTKSLRRTTSGLAIVAPSSTSTTDPIILGRKDPVKVRKSPSVSASQTNKITEEINFLTVGKKNPRRLSLMDNLRLPFLNLERKLSREERSDKETVSNKEKDGSVINRDASKSLNERVLNNVKNGPFSPNSAPTKRKKSVEFKKGSKEEALPKISVSVINSDELRPQEAIPKISVTNSDQLRPQSPREKNESPRTSSKQRPLSLSQMDPNPMPEPPVISTVTPPTPPQMKKSYTSVELVKPPVTTFYKDLYTPRLNRAMTTIDFRHSQLPTLLEASPLDHGSLADGEQESANEQKETRKPRKYFGSHTTSTYEYGHKDSAPDATERRRLIGFLHRTSHLSLTTRGKGSTSLHLAEIQIP
uniref:Uncharacterized protein n=1 Tax=Acrobeloides nanus TaxID=290746 RepID=A0A914DNB8_9BILA